MNFETAHEWRAISVRQPWAELLISGRKSIEIRSWVPEYRGRLWMHASLKRDPELERRFGFNDLYRGGFIGSIRLVAVVPLTSERWMQWQNRHLDASEYRGGLVAWIMDAPRRFPIPVPGKGKFGLFYPATDVVQQLRRSESALESRE